MPGVDWGVLGSAIHACLAASFTNEGTWLAEERVSQVLQAFQVRTHIDAADLCKQIAAFHAWVRQRWPGCTAKAEVPVTALLSNGQILNGRIDLLLETDQGYVLIDHKSSPLGEAQWDEIVGSHQGQLAAYAGAIEAATGSKVIEQWLWLPVAGGMVRASL
jgi:ATP-dependent exoDNAse (exonuclease V) beta subunit